MIRLSSSRTRSTIAMLAIMLLSLTVKLALWSDTASSAPALFLGHDSPSYYQPAEALLQSGRLAISPELSDIPLTLRTPGYPLYIATCYLLLGEHSQTIILLQLLMSILTIALIFALGRKLWGRKTAVLAGLLLAFDVTTTAYSLLVLTETLFTLFITAMLLAGALFIQTKRIRWAVMTGLTLAGTILVRPVSYYLIVPLLIGALVWSLVLRWNRARLASMMVALVLPFATLVGGWQLRNYITTGHAYVSQIQGINMLFFRGASVVALRDGIDLDQARTAVGGDEFGILRDRAILHPEQGLSIEWERQGLDIILSNPAEFLRVWLRGTTNIFVGPGDGDLARFLDTPHQGDGPLGDLLRLSPSEYLDRWVLARNPIPFLVFAFALGYLVVVYVGVGRWFWRAFQAREMVIEYLYLWGVFLYLVVVSAGPEAYYRFRVPLMPILVLFAAQGLRRMPAERKQHQPPGRPS